MQEGTHRRATALGVFALLAIGAIAALLSGCGGDSSSDSTATTASSGGCKEVEEPQHKEVSLKANAEQIKKYKKDLNAITSKKEFDALNIEIAGLEKRNGDLEDEGLQLMTLVEEAAAKIPTFEQAIKDIAKISTRLLRSLETTAAPKNREEEAAKAKARAAERYANN